MTRRAGWRACAVLIGALVGLLLITSGAELAGWHLMPRAGDGASADRGTLLVVRPVRADALRVGDVVVFADRARPESTLVRRILTLVRREGRLSITTATDTEVWDVTATQVVDRVALTVPYAGYPAALIVSLPVRLLIVLGAVVVLFREKLTGLAGRKTARV